MTRDYDYSYKIRLAHMRGSAIVTALVLAALGSALFSCAMMVVGR